MEVIIQFDLNLTIHFVVEFHERLFGLIIKTIQTDLNGLGLVTKDVIGTDNVDQTTGGDHFIHTTIKEGLTDDVSPGTQILSKGGEV